VMLPVILFPSSNRHWYAGQGSGLANEIAFPWQQGDVLMLDNMLVAHGGSSYKGTRRILASLSQPFDSCAPL
jgi:alpha-ketoglutarate-dependent taurine dioxygenase